jgi:hypothetical protein
MQDYPLFSIAVFDELGVLLSHTEDFVIQGWGFSSKTPGLTDDNMRTIAHSWQGY